MPCGVLKVFFTADDLMRTRLASGPDPLWEMVFSLHRLRGRTGGAALANWRAAARARLLSEGLAPLLRDHLIPLLPEASYFPDFMTPPEAAVGFDQGLAAILDTPRTRVRTELEALRTRTGLGAGHDDLSRGDPRALRRLGRAVSGYHQAGLAPHWSAVEKVVNDERMIMMECLAADGVEGMLAGLPPTMRWRAPVLEVAYSPGDHELHLLGRGLTLIPSYFATGTPVALADPTLPPVIVYPARRAERHGSPGDTADPLSALMGHRRAQLLRLIASTPGYGTGQLARITGVPASSISEHTAVLREAGLLSSVRHRGRVLHRATELGQSLTCLT